MSGLSTFGSFTQARLGIYASQAGLSITGNNISNINTPGYTRQKLEQTSFYAGGTDRYYSSGCLSIGNGVLCTGTSQMRDPYLDLRYRNEMASVGSMDSKMGNLSEIQRILDETGKGEDGFGILGAQISDIFKQLEHLNNHTGLAEYDIQVRSSAESLAKLFNSYASQLKEVKKNADHALQVDVDSVNTILTSIRDLSANIRKAELHGDGALELRDERNLLIDKLSEFMKIDVTYGEENVGGTKVEKLMISLADANPDKSSPTDQSQLINGIYGTQISIADDAHLTVSLDALVDRHGKKYLDPKTMTYSQAVTLADNDLYGSLQSQREFLTKSGEFSTAEDLALDPKATEKRGVVFYQKALDLLASQFANAFNDANQGFVRNENGQYVNSDGNVIMDENKIPYTDASFQGLDTHGKEIMMEKIKKAGGQFLGCPLFSTSGNSDNTDGINASNISISNTWSKGPKIVSSFIQHGSAGIGSTDSSNIGHMLVILGTKMDYLAKENNPDSLMFHGTFNEMWDNLGTVLGNDMMITNTMLNTYQTASVQLETSRDSVSSVDLNDEAMNLMQYSKSYSAACRLMTTVDTVLEKLINGTGVTR